MVFGKQSLQGYESNRWNADGVRAENIPKSNERQTYSVSLRTSKAGSSSCRCTTTLNGKQKETKDNVNTIHRQLRIMLANSLAVIGLS